MKRNIILTLIILGLGTAMVLVGTIILFQYDTSHTGYYGGLARASTSIEFGGDFYTSSAQATGLAANAVVDLYSLASILSGAFFIFIGIKTICSTLLQTNIKLADIKDLFKKNEATEKQTE